jgi:hypothetical protein
MNGKRRLNRGPVRRPQNWRRAFLEPLEDRRVLDAGAEHVFAQFSGVLASAGDMTQFDIAIVPPTNFTLSRGNTALGFWVRADGSALDPTAVQIRNSAGKSLPPLYSYPDLAGTNFRQSLMLATLGAGNYSITVGGQRGSLGAFELDVFLAGDIDGDRVITIADILQVRDRHGATGTSAVYEVEADANLDGRIDWVDYGLAKSNLGDAARLNPLALSITGLSPEATQLADGSYVTSTSAHQLLADVTSSATVSLETDSDGAFDEGTLTAGPGAVAFDLAGKLSAGANTVQLRARDSFGQQKFGSAVVILDTIQDLPFGLSAGSDTGEADDQRTSAARVTLVGQAAPGSLVTLQPGGLTALASGLGVFQFVDVGLAVGDNVFTVTAVDPAGNATSSTQTIRREAAAAQKDVVLQWNEAALDAVRMDSSSPPVATRFLAMVHLAIFDVVSGVEGTPGYYVTLAPPAAISLEAAVSAAAAQVLAYAYPGQISRFDAKLEEVLDGIPDGAGEDNGVAYGRQIGDAIIAIRDSDGWNDYVDYVPNSATGRWQPTPPMYDVGLLPQWANLTPFAMSSPDQFLVDGPPPLDSPEYAAGWDEVRRLGRIDSTERTADQKQIARFWADGPGTFTPPGHWNKIADQMVAARGDSLSANARTFAMLNVALADAGIASWNAKYEYDLWRPITAIQRAGEDGNSATQADPTWQPLLITPPFPEYTSGHSTFSGAAAQILSAVIGEDVPFSTTSFGLPGVVRSFDNFHDAAMEASKSRIYGGIHYSFSGLDGLAAGHALADWVLERFSVQEDTQPPVVIIDSPPAGLVHPGDITVAGRVIDYLSGVQSLEYRVDGGPLVPVSFTAQGNFVLPLTGLPDGHHTLHLHAIDEAGNATNPVAFAFRLDSASPVIQVTSPLGGQALEVGDRLVGTANPTGSLLVSLTYEFEDGNPATDEGGPLPIFFDAVSGAFNEPLDFSALLLGDYSLVVTATDSAGNVATEIVQVSLESPPAFALAGISPQHGAIEVGSTFRPRIDFTTPVNSATLNSSNLYASFGGQKLPATIVPANDGTFAWLFFSDPMPGASLIRVTVNGSTIMAANGSGALDADNDGTPGGVRTFDFTTVSLAPLANTSLSGKIVDPGVDLKPMTFDDIRAGADGALHTPDDVFLNPIAHVKVFILGLEDQFVYTDSQGKFSFDSVPAGTIKLALDGHTATNAPAGYYFPEMVMDLRIEAGRANTVMGTMGTNAEKEANHDRPEVYLPRIRTDILETVSNTAVTVVDVIPEAAPNLSPEQRQYLTIEVQPGSAIGPDGQPVTNPQIGISTVPPELVRDMLPPGVLQHTFDITVQAPGTATLSEPAPMTFPNVFNAPPGSKLNFLSFDHTTGLLVIEGTATVSADGKSVRTDPDTGITHPGWHGLTPPGGCGGPGGPPPTPPPAPGPDDTVNQHEPEVLPMIFGEPDGTRSLTWTAPAPRSDLPPPPTPAPGSCDPPPPPADDDAPQQPYLAVNIQIDGPLDEFMKQPPDAINALPLSSYSFTLQAGQIGKVIFGITPKTYDELFAEGIQLLDVNKLYGSQIKITEIRGNPDGSRTYDYYTYYVYRFVNGTDTNYDDTIEFEETIVDGHGNAEREKRIEMNAGPASMPSLQDTQPGEPYFVLGGGERINFDPLSGGDDRPGEIVVRTPDGREVPGWIKLRGDAKPKQEINLDMTALKAALLDFSFNFDTYITSDPGLKAKYQGLADADGSYTALANEIKARVVSLYTGFPINIVDAQSSASSSVRNRYPATNPKLSLLGTSAPGGGVDLDKANLKTYFDTYMDYSQVQQGFQLDQYLNQTLPGLVDTIIRSHVTLYLPVSRAAFVNNFADTLAHEDGHNLGLNHPFNFKNPDGTDVQTHPDIMSYAIDNNGILVFHQDYSQSVLKLDLMGNWSFEGANSDVYRANRSLMRWSAKPVKTADGSEDEGEFNLDLPGAHLLIDAGDGLVTNRLDLGTVVSDGDGGARGARTLEFANFGNDPLIVFNLSIPNSAGVFSLSTPVAPGTIINPGESVSVTIQFDPLAVGAHAGTLAINSNDANFPHEIQLTGFGQSPTPYLAVEHIDNNLGGILAAAGSAAKSALATITNWGASELLISAVSLAEGIGRFGLTGVPANLALNPIVLAFGETFSFGMTFDPDHVGLDRALVNIVSNDPANPVQLISAVGTGLDEIVYPEWGDDYHAIDTPALPGADTLRVVSDDEGNFEVFLPPSTPYEYHSFDPDTGLIARSISMTAPSGGGVYLARTLVFGPSSAIDTDFDGLPDDIEHAVGTNPEKKDTNEDGVDDYTAIQSGIDPLGLQGLPLGIIGTVQPQGTINVQDVVASSDTAYLAAGAGGIQVVDISNIIKPSVIASVPAATLGGNAVAVAFTSIPGEAPGTFQNLVAAALGDKGLAIVDVTDPPAAFLVSHIPIPGSALSVQIVDNLAYVGGAGGVISIVDVKSQELVTTFTASGTGDVTAVRFNAGTLYTLRGGRLSAYDLAANLAAPPLLSSLDFHALANSLFVGSSRAYVAGFRTLVAVDITNPSNLQGPPNALPPSRFDGPAANGSGRLIVAQADAGLDFKVGLFNVEDPDNTNLFLTQFDTAGSARRLFIQNGYGLVADDTAGLAILNYLPFDQGTTPPIITVATTAASPTTVMEGSRLRVDVSTLDDVQTREVALSVNGVALEPDGSFPFSFFVDVPTMASGATQFDLLVTATDTGGNQSAQTLSWTIIPDTVPPQLLSVLPADDRIQFNAVQSLRTTFNEPLDLATLNSATIQVFEAGLDGNLGTADDVPVALSSLDFDFRLSLNMLTVIPAAPLGPGKYELRLDRSAITDRAGNPLGAGLFRSQVTVQAIPFNAVISGEIFNPGQVDLYSFQAAAGGQVTLFADWGNVEESIQRGQISLIAPDGSTVLGAIEGDDSSLLSNLALPVTGVYTVMIRAASTDPLDTGDYHFTISDPEAEYETIAYGETKLGTFAVRGDDQEWQFAATAGDLVAFSYTGPELEYGITFFNPDGSIESTLPAGSTLIRFAVPVSQTGIYRFVLETETHTGNYAIQLGLGTFIDVIDPGIFNFVQTGSIDPLYNIDRYRYHLAAGDVVTVYAAMFEMGQGELRLIDAATGADLVPPQSGSDAQITRYQSPADQDVFVEVRGKVGSFQAGPYQLSVSSPEAAFETIAFGDQMDRFFAVRGDDQEWQFEAEGGETVTFGYRGPHLEAGITILRPDGSTLDFLPAGIALVRRDLVLDQAGTYRFILTDDNSPGDYSLNLSNPADVESPGAGLVANIPQPHAVGTVFDVDVFTFEAAAGLTFSILGEWLPGGAGVEYGEIELIDPAGNVVATAAGQGASTVAVASAAVGTYQVRIRASGGHDFNRGAYRVTAFAGSEDPANDTIATAVATGISAIPPNHYATTAFIGDNLQGVRDVDLYRVDAARGDVIIAAVTIGSLVSDLDSHLRLFDAAGIELSFNQGIEAGGDSLLQFKVLNPGAYYLGVSAGGNEDYDANAAGTDIGNTVGSYNLSLDVVRDQAGPRVSEVSPVGTSTAEDVTQFKIRFDEKLNAAAATSAANYILVQSTDGVFDDGNDVVIPVAASYDDVFLRVTLTLAAPLPVGDIYRLTMRGTGESPITDIAGNPLNDGLDETSLLNLVLTLGTPTEDFPLIDGFESGVFADYWTISTGGGARAEVVTGDGPHDGARHAHLSNLLGPAGRAAFILLVDYSALADDADVDLSYWHHDRDFINQMMPASFAGRVNADGVAISNDGINWVRIDDLSAAPELVYNNHVIDLDGAVEAAGLTFDQPLQILFQHHLVQGHNAYFDDIRLAPDLAGPTITSLSTPGPLFFGSVSSIVIDFSEPLQLAGATNPASYELVGNASQSPIALAASYDAAQQRVTLNLAEPLEPGPYFLRVRGSSGVSQVRDASGNPLNNGRDSEYRFYRVDVESPSDDATATATETGLSHEGGTYELTTAIGNNSFEGRDVDLYSFTAAPGDRLNIEADAQAPFGSLSINTLLRLFDAEGNVLASNDDRFPGFTDSAIGEYEIFVGGTYFIGVSTSGNTDYDPLLAPSGTTGPQGLYRISVSLTPDTTPPQVVSVTPHAGPNLTPSVEIVQIVFNEPMDAVSAADPANFSLTYLGADGQLSGGDDIQYVLTAEHSFDHRRTTLTLTDPAALLPLPTGKYALVAKATAGGITDLAGNPLTDGNDFVHNFEIIEPEEPLNDRLVEAYDTGILADGGSYTIGAAIGDNAFGLKDVDLYRLEARAGLRLTATLAEHSIDSALHGRLRLFDGSGTELHSAGEASNDELLNYDITLGGIYYLGVSGSGNEFYNPDSPGSGTDASSTGEYILTIQTEDVIAPTVASMTPAGLVVNTAVQQITIEFSEPMIVAAAQDSASYVITLSGPDRQFDTPDDVTLSAAAYSAVYDATADRVQLSLSSPLPNGDVRVTMLAAPLVDRGGLHLNGSVLGGSDEVLIFSVMTAGVLPYYDSLNAASLGANWTTILSDPLGVVDVTGLGGPRQGAGHMRMTSTTRNQWATAVNVLAIDAAAASQLELSFYAKRGEFEDAHLLPATFGNDTPGDGVAISVDGAHWFRVVDLTDQPERLIYDHYVVDLAAAATLHALPLTGLLLIRFSNSEFRGDFDPVGWARYFDDIRVAADANSPEVFGLTVGNFLTAVNPNSLGVVFSESVTPASATDPANYLLVRAGGDHLLGTSDDVSVVLGGIIYDDAARTATLTTVSTMPADAYRLTVLSSIVDPSGVPLNEGLAQPFDFDAVTSETAENQTPATATSTGLTTAADGLYSITTAIGNSSQGLADVDHYRLEGAAGQRLKVALSRFGDNNAHLIIRVLNQSGTEIAAANSSIASPQFAVALASSETYFVSVSAADAGGGIGLYKLDLETDSGVAVPPLAQGFEATNLPAYFTIHTSDASGTVETTTSRAFTGTRSLRLGDTDAGLTLKEATLTFDATALPSVDLKFHAMYRPRFESVPLAPPGGSYVGHFNGDGVAISVDGITWYPIIDFHAERVAGRFPYNTWTRFLIDLDAAAAAVGIPLTDTMQLRFQHYNAGPINFGSGLFLDDIILHSDLIGPQVTTATGLDGFVVAEDLTSLSVTFNEPLDSSAANLAANYQFRAAGPDQHFQTSDDQVLALVPTYNAATRTTSLAISGAGAGLPIGAYRLRLIGVGVNALRDPTGNLLNDGANKDIVFGVFPPEDATNNTMASATATGVTTAGGGYQIGAMLGNDGPDSSATFNDIDFYRIDAAAGQSLYVSAHSDYGDPNLRVRVFNAAGAEILSHDDPAAGDLLVDNFTLTSGGMYFIAISDAANDSYDPTSGGGDSGTTRGRYALQLYVVQPAEFPFFDDLESGTFNGARWDAYTIGGGTVKVRGDLNQFITPLDGSFSAHFSTSPLPPNHVFPFEFYQQAELTLHVNLAGVTNAELRFKERGNHDPGSFELNAPNIFTGRYYGSDGAYLSVDGTTFHRIEGVFDNSISGGVIYDRSIDLDEFAALNGLTLSPHVLIRFQANIRHDGTTGRWLDNFVLVADTAGPEISELTHNASGASNDPRSTSLLNENPIVFTATFTDRLDAARAASSTAYDWSFAGPDGNFGTGDDVAIPLSPLYDGNFKVTLSAAPALAPYPTGASRLTFRGIGPAALRDNEGNLFHGGTDLIYPFTVIDPGPQIVPPTDPTENEIISPSEGFSSIALTFNEAIDPASFTGDDVAITYDLSYVAVDPDDIAVSGSGTNWTITWPAIHFPGHYVVRIGPNIADLAGSLMNQNHDLVNGAENEYYQIVVRVTDPPTNVVTLRDAGGFRYDVQTNGGVFGDGGRYANPPPDSTLSHTNSYNEFAFLNGYNNSGLYALEDGGRTVVLDQADKGGLRVHREVFVPDSGTFARVIDVFTNPGTAPITQLIEYEGFTSSSIITASSDGDLVFDPTDTYLATDNSVDGDNRASLGHVFMDGQRLTLVSTFRNNSRLEWSFNITVGPGQTVRLMMLETQQLSRAEALAQAANLVTLPPAALANLTAEEKGSILNFNTGFDAIAPHVISTSPDLSVTQTGNIAAISATFSEQLNAATAGDPANYRLIFAGPDHQLDTPDDTAIALTPVYDDSTRTVALAINAASAPLVMGRYRLEFLPAIEDLAGNPLLGGTAQRFDFNVIHGARILSVLPIGQGEGNVVLSDPGALGLLVEFDRPIDAATFTGADVFIAEFSTQANVVIDPANMSVSGSGTTWQVTFASPLQVPGFYIVGIGPDILENGRPMNQDQDFVLGGDEDAFATLFQVMQATGFALLDPAAAGTGPPNEGQTVTIVELAPLMSEAIASWIAAGADSRAFEGLALHITDLSDGVLAMAGERSIWIDDDAAGQGWYIDASPADDSEFAASEGPAAGKVDLLTILMHELGHILGKEHKDEGLMDELLAPGIRRRPSGQLNVHDLDAFFDDLGQQQ